MGGTERPRVAAMAGNPNVGKSTVFNALTGLHQHTGNWAGKTVTNARGYWAAAGYELVDLPGTYSLLARSAEEAAARQFLCFAHTDAVVVVCDATCLERNLNLALQIMELPVRVVLCVNLMDEAARKGIRLDLPALERRLGVPVVGVAARRKRTLAALEEALARAAASPPAPRRVDYPAAVEEAVAALEPSAAACCGGRLDSRWLSLRLLEGEPSLLAEIDAFLGAGWREDPGLLAAEARARHILAENGLGGGERLSDAIVAALAQTAEALCRGVVTREGAAYAPRDRRLDRLLTSRATGYPVMLLLLAGALWLSIVGANVPSQWLSAGLGRVQAWLTAGFAALGAPDWLHGLLVLGAFRVLAWVVAVMLPPMAIFFPLFTLLEDAGYLPRVAYNLDRPFQRCRACGKQALCMCMGFGCNAAGVVGCRIIDSPRERLLAILTNSFVPCNGRFPTLIALLTMFFAGTMGGGTLRAALLLTVVIVAGVATTLGVTGLLSRTLLRGMPSAFTLELPPYRRPQLGRTLLRSVLDRTVFVLGRAAAVAAPAGAVLWLLANVDAGGQTLLQRCAGALDPLGRLMGLDGVILLAFVLGLPANEIVLPVVIMAYTAQGSLTGWESLPQLRALLEANGWTWVTAVNMLLFTLNHWPCSTTLLTIRKETGSWRWTAAAAAIPTAVGMAACMLFTAAVRLVT